MDTAELFIAIGGAAAIAFILWFFFGQKEETESRVASAQLEVDYSCPMHPWITSDDPGALCSICGMKLTRTHD